MANCILPWYSGRHLMQTALKLTSDVQQTAFLTTYGDVRHIVWHMWHCSVAGSRLRVTSIATAEVVVWRPWLERLCLDVDSWVHVQGNECACGW